MTPADEHAAAQALADAATPSGRSIADVDELPAINRWVYQQARSFAADPALLGRLMAALGVDSGNVAYWANRGAEEAP